MPESVNSTWDGQGAMMVAGQVGIVNSWAEYMPGVDSAESKTQGLWTPVTPVIGKALRPIDQAGFGEITTEVAPLGDFFYAEPYHQQYLGKNPNGYCGMGGTGVACSIGIL
jgi:peptide-methionine (S)-S-oxide reductase